MPFALTILSALILSGCGGTPEGHPKSSNPSFNVERLFEVDGCRVYRFWDGLAARYFANCPGSVSWHRNSGKTTVPEDVPTGALGDQP